MHFDRERTVLTYASVKREKKNVQFVRKIAAKRIEKRCRAFYQPRLQDRFDLGGFKKQNRYSTRFSAVL